MKKIKLLALMAMMSIGCQAQVTYFETNNFLLNYFTNSGFLAYDWRFEPQKTDVERGNLKRGAHQDCHQHHRQYRTRIWCSFHRYHLL